MAQYVKTLGAWLSQRGHRVVYLVGESKTKTWKGGQVYSLSSNLTVKFNGNKLSTPFPAKANKIKEVLTSNKFDVVHVQTPHSPFMASRVIAKLPKNTPVVSTFHILPNSWSAKAGSVLLRIAYLGSLKRINKAFAVSDPAKLFAKKYYSLECEISPNMIDLAKFNHQSDKLEKNSRKKNVIFLGRLVKRKGCLQLLEAFNAALKKDPNMNLKIAGDGEQKKQLEKYVSKNNLTEKITFLGYIDEKDKAKLLSSADIAVFPSTGGESFGIVLLEAMAAGAGCVLAGDNPGYRSVLASKAELLVDVHDKEAFSMKLLNLPGSFDYRSWQKEYVKKFDVEVVGKQIENSYYSLID